MEILIGFFLGLLLFQVNHRIKRFTEIKTIINTIFEMYSSYDFYQDKTNLQTLTQEIFNLEKMHDNNIVVKNQITNLYMLRTVYSRREPILSKDEFNDKIAFIGFKKLNKGFIILSYFNIML